MEPQSQVPKINQEYILVIGEDEVGRAIILRVLADKYNTDSLSDPGKISKKLDTLNCRLVIIDMIGYEKDPCALLKEIRGKHRDLSVIVLADPRVMFAWGNSLKTLADRVLVSPLDPAKLLKDLGELLQHGASVSSQSSAVDNADQSGIGGPVAVDNKKTVVKEPVPKQVVVVKPPTERTVAEQPVSDQSFGNGFKRKIIAVGGGKGGVGKSLLTVNLGAGLTRGGKKVIVVDLDIGGPNLHTYFGIRKLDRGLFDFLLTDDVHLGDVVCPTNIEGLQIIGITKDYPDAANIKYKRKLRLVDSLKHLDADYILLDLGSGTDFNVTDFFSITGGGIIVSSTDVTSILNTYSFIKSLFYREMAKHFMVNGKGDLLEVAKKVTKDDSGTQVKSIDDLEKELIKVDPEAEEMLRFLKRRIRARLIVNMVKKSSDIKIGDSIIGIVKKYLDIDVEFIGSVTRDSAVEASVAAMYPFLLSSPSSSASCCVKNIINKLV
ncbi:MAG: P-loop NTPase [Candidatus Anammoxibacter sp.]